MTGNVGRALRYRERVETDPEYRERLRERYRIQSRHRQKFGRKPKLVEDSKFSWHKAWKVTDEDVKRNLEKVEQGQDLDMPLAVLDGTFKHIYRKNTEKRCKKELQKTDKYKKQFNEWKKGYYSRPEIKEKIREYSRKYNQREGVRERCRELARRHSNGMSALKEIYHKEYKEIKDTMKNLHWEKRQSKASLILRQRHQDEYNYLIKIITKDL